MRDLVNEKRYCEGCKQDFCVEDHYYDHLGETEALSGTAIKGYLQYLSDRVEELEKQIKDLKSIKWKA